MGNLLAGNVAALIKSAEIWTRGFGTLQRAAAGSAWMTFDDSIAEARSSLSCQSLDSLFQLRAEMVRVSLGRLAGHARLIARMMSDLIEDALFPLERRVVLVLEHWDRTATASPELPDDGEPARA
jgi:hypothetical protein